MRRLIRSIQAEWHRLKDKKLHDPSAYGCRYWTGDRAGVELRAVCKICGPGETS